MISLRGAKLHNLKNVDADFPKNKITVVCGPSGCGKSSLALDTLHGECRRRYLESLSPFAVRVLGGKRYIPLDDASGLVSSVAIGPVRGDAPAKSSALSLACADSAFHTLFARMALPICPKCGHTAAFYTREQIVSEIANFKENSRIQFIIPIEYVKLESSITKENSKRTLDEFACVFLPLGYSRALVNDIPYSLTDIPIKESKNIPQKFELVVDRIIVREGVRTRISEAVDACLRLSHDYLEVDCNGTRFSFSTLPRCKNCKDTLILQAPTPESYSPYSLSSACENCHGTGFLDEEYEVPCNHCRGLRLKPVFLNAVVNSKYSYADLVQLNFKEFKERLEELFKEVPKSLRRTRDTLLARLSAIEELGLSYLNPCRSGVTLSGGELSRLRLVSAVSGYLDGMLFCLDEPAAGLHKEDAIRLYNVLEKICKRGNTLVLMEHNPEIVKRADWIIEMGPAAGVLGGRVLAMGARDAVLSDKNSPTGNWLRRLDSYKNKEHLKTLTEKAIVVENFSAYGMVPVFAKFPVGAFSVITGPSGSGKSTLMFKHLAKMFTLGHYAGLGIEAMSIVYAGNFQGNRRSMVITAMDLYTPLRELFSKLPESKIRGYTALKFSLHAPGGRCETCKGEGVLIESYGLEETECPVCLGRRFRDDVLEIRFKSLSIADVLEMSVESAMHLFEAYPKFYPKLRALVSTGLGYLRLGQITSNMSSGERSRLRLSMSLSKSNPQKTLYLFDEPARGLHDADIQKLLQLFHELSLKGHTLIAIEHSEDFINSADYVLELSK